MTKYYRLITKALPFLIAFFPFISAFSQVSVTATGGTTTATYTTLKESFDAINAGTHQGAINISITASTTETASAVLNASGNALASYASVIIKPAATATPTITGSVANLPLVALNGANNVTIDGSNNGTTSRDLTITNSSTTAPNVVAIVSVGTTPVMGDTLKNCNLVNGANTSSSIFIGDANADAGYFNNITIRNNSVRKGYTGIYLMAVSTANNGSNVLIAQNDLNNTGANAIRNVGVYAQGVNGTVISNNNIGNFVTTNAEIDCGILLESGTTNTTVKDNNIATLAYTGNTGGLAPVGINVAPAIANAAILVSGNTISNISSSKSGVAAGIYWHALSSGVTIEKNKISNIKNTNATTSAGSCGIWLQSDMNASATLVSDNFVSDIASFGATGYNVTNNGNGIVVDGGGGYDIYHNTVVMNTNQTFTGGSRASAFLATANATVSSSVNLKNNILVNLQTVGNANSRFALSNNGDANVFATMDNNDYYAASTKLTSQGTNASITNSVAQVQTAFGSNANSQSVLPLFTSATDLHLVATSNTAINNTGAVIASVTTDIDNQLRSSTAPDMGADEFEDCHVVAITTQPSPAAICEGANTSFTVVASNGNLYQWQVNSGSGFTDITNGGMYSGATTATLSLAAPGNIMSGYTYRCIISYATVCTPVNSNAAPLTVNTLPVVTITNSGSTSFCPGGSVSLSVPTGSNLTYSWTDGNGIVGIGNSYTATTTGTYSVTVQNTITTCSATSVPVSVSSTNGPVAVIAGAATNYICHGDVLALQDANATPNGVSYTWRKDGNIISGATNNSISVNDAGAYTMTVSIGPSCSNVSGQVQVYFHPVPTATVTPAGPVTLCLGSNATLQATASAGNTYQWFNSGSAITAALSDSYIAGGAGSYTVTVTDAATGCTNTSSPVAITSVPLPLALINPATATTACDSLLLNANNDVLLSYQWQLNGNVIPGATQQQFAADFSGTYTVTTTNGNSCSRTSDPVDVTIHASPEALVTYNSPLSFCDGGAVSLNAFDPGGNTYQWLKNGLPVGGATDNYYVATETSTLAVLVTSVFGCYTFSAPLPVIVHPLPNPDIITDGLRLSTDEYFGYQWFFNNTAISGAADSFYWATQNGGYRVVVTDGNGCTNQSATVIIDNVGVQQIAALGNDIHLYPNPFKNYLNVKTGKVKTKSIELVSMTGAIVATKYYEQPVNEAGISIDDVADGMYLVRITTDKGMYTAKVRKVNE